MILISDVIEIPYEKLADWIALIGSALVYGAFAIGVFYGRRLFATRTRMRVLTDLLAALLLVAGLTGYFEVFVAIDKITYRRAVVSAFRGTSAGRNDPLLDQLVEERARSVRGSFIPIDARRVAFYVLPLAAVVVPALLARDRT